MLDERLADEVERLEAAKRKIERELSVLRASPKDEATLGGPKSTAVSAVTLPI